MKIECSKCKTEMIIDSWNGWRWTCFHCDHVDREATEEEIHTSNDFKTNDKKGVKNGYNTRF